MAYGQARRPKIAVIGTGILGLAVAGELSRCGCEVSVYDKNEDHLQQVHRRLDEQRAQLMEEDLLTAHESFSVIVESHLSRAVMEADFVFEAIVEDLAIKNTLMKNLSLMCSDDAVICSNTLTLNLDSIFSDVKYPQRTIGVRFLLPVYFIPLVEVTTHHHTSTTTINKVDELLRFIKKESFRRGSDELPRKLAMHEARAMQLTTARPGRSCDADTSESHVHNLIAKGSHDARLSHGHS